MSPSLDLRPKLLNNELQSNTVEIQLERMRSLMTQLQVEGKNQDVANDCQCRSGIDLPALPTISTEIELVNEFINAEIMSDICQPCLVATIGSFGFKHS